MVGCSGINNTLHLHPITVKVGKDTVIMLGCPPLQATYCSAAWLQEKVSKDWTCELGYGNFHGQRPEIG